MDARYLLSASPVRGTRVFGFRVSGITLRHVWALEFLGSPYAVGGVPDVCDAVEAAMVLSARNDAELQRILEPAGWWRRLAGVLRGVRYGKRVAAECAKLEEHLAREMIMPKLLDPGERGKKLAMPWLCTLVCRVARECGLALDAAWWQRFSSVVWANVSWQELDGAEPKLVDEKLLEELIEMGWSEDDL